MISRKLGLGYLAMAALLIAIGGAGYFASDKINRALEIITGPVYQTDKAVSAGIRAVQMQMLEIDHVIRVRSQDPRALLAPGQEMAQNAYQVLQEQGLVSPKLLNPLGEAMDRFNQASTELMDLRSRYRISSEALKGTLSQMQSVLARAEEQVNRRVVASEWNLNVAEDEETGTKESKAWDLISTLEDVRLALMTWSYAFQQLLEAPDDIELQRNADAHFADLKLYSELVAESELIAQMPIEKGENSGKTYAAVLLELLEQSKQQVDLALSQYRDLNVGRLNYTKVADEMMRLAENIEVESAEILASSIHDADLARDSALIIVISMAFVGLGVGLLAYWVSLRTIAQPVKTLASRLKDIAQGEGDLTIRLEERGDDELTDVSRGFNQFSEKIRLTVCEVNKGVAHLAETASRINQITSVCQGGVQNQLSETREVQEAMVEMVESVSDVTDSAATAVQGASQANDEAVSGKHLVENTLKAIESLSEQVDSANQTIDQLEKESQDIGSVLDVIGGIAEQTNLLALNAAIEAARAGEQGRGFAVVADEVRTLASRTQQSTSEIQRMIEKLQQGARRAAGVMADSQSQAQETLQAGRRTGESFNRIVEFVSSIHGVNENIAQAAQRQKQGASRVQQNAKTIKDSGAALNQNFGEMTDATQSLNQLSENLNQLVLHFKT